MNIKYILGLILVLILVACAPAKEPAAPEPSEPAAPSDDMMIADAEAPSAPEEDMAADAEAPSDDSVQTVVSGESTKDISELSTPQIENLKKACNSGNAGLCAALARYGIEMKPGDLDTAAAPDADADMPDADADMSDADAAE